MRMLRVAAVALIVGAYVGSAIGCVSDVGVKDDGGSDTGTSLDAASDVNVEGGATDADAAAPPCDIGKPFKNPTLLPGPVNTPQDETTARLSWDELTLYFATYRPDAGALHFEIWFARRSSISDAFGTPSRLANINDVNSSATQGTISKDDLTYFFESNRNGTWDIFTASRQNPGSPSSSPFSSPAIVANLSTANANEQSPFLSADGKELWYSSDQGDAGAGRQILRAMGPAFATGTEQVELNGAFSDYGPVLSADGLNIYFNSDRPGGSGNLDVWFATRASLGAAFQPPVNAATLNSQINTSYSDRVGCISPDGCRLYLVSSRPGVGASDIYIAERSL